MTPGTSLPRNAAALAALALLAACGSGPKSAADAPKPVACANLDAAVKLAGLKITAAAEQKADDKGHPAHCRVTGTLNERTGIDGRRYAIGFEMRLPANWNQRFLHQVNGGNDGEVKPAFGDMGVLAEDALTRGFAVISSDSGHDGKDPANAAAALAQGNVFGLDPQARRDYGYTANASVYPVAQALIKAHYGQSPQRNYMAGCSNGGRHAMVAASRYADQYDGFLAGAPGFNLPKAAVQHAWDIQSWRLASPDIRKAFSPADLKAVADMVVQRCDGLDQLVDGMVSDVKRCQAAFRVESLRCQTNQTTGCLNDNQIKALQKSFAGPVNGRGEALYSDWWFDTGIASAGWRAWKLESQVPPWDRMPIIATMGAGSLGYIFSTPPNRPPGTPNALLDSLLAFDFDRDAPKIYARQAPFNESAMDFMTPPDAANPKAEGLRKSRGKLLVYHGMSDPVFSVVDTLRWADKLQANLGSGGAAEVARVFPVPGMGHCQGGPATDRFDVLGALVDWVENGKAPDRIIATLSPGNKEVPANWSPTRSRPLCPWPLVSRYAGGDVDSAASFRCAAP